MTGFQNRPRHFPVSWQEMHRDARALAWRLLEKGPWKGVIAVARGGLFPAGIVARELNLPVVETVCIYGYDDVKQVQHDPRMEKPVGSFATEGQGEGWIVVDDLVDSGKTFEQLRKTMPKAHYAALYAKPEGSRQADSWVTEVSQDTWIFFPWEVDTTFATPIAIQPGDRR
ncbi:MAG: xanthine phosphoribosyltransferase [Pseudomonadota bacterium]|nr:xanthine phosphoribosyltransferase [Pseudomonadota bacterium]